MLGEAGQQYGAERDTEQPGWKFHQAVGVVQPRHAAGHQKRRKDGVDKQADLTDRHTEHRGPHLLHHAPHARVPEVGLEARQHVNPQQERNLKRELQRAAAKYRPCQRHHRRIEIRRQPQCEADESQVEQCRRQRRHRKPAVRVEDAAGERHQRNKNM